MTPELLKSAKTALDKFADVELPAVGPNSPNTPASGRKVSWEEATPFNRKNIVSEAHRLKNDTLGHMALKARQYMKRPTRIVSTLLRPLNALFNTRGGNALLTAAFGYSQMAEQMAPKVMSKFKFAAVQSNSNNRSRDMKTLKDILVEKIAAAKRQSSRRADLPFTVKDADVEFISKVASAAMPSGHIEKKAGPVNWLTDAAQSAMPTLQLGALGAMTGMAIAGLYDRASDYLKRNSAYEQMFREFPMLNEVPREQVDKFWNVLNDFAPKLTTNPVVAGQFIENMLNYGVKGIDHNVAGQLLQTEAAARNAGGRDIFDLLSTLGKSSFDAGARAMSGGSSD